jgi:hypothetical protein
MLAKCNGPIFGAKISSYRSEAYGILSVLRFLLRLSQIHSSSGGTISSHLLVCDNKGVVSCITELKTWTEVYPCPMLQL